MAKSWISLPYDIMNPKMHVLLATKLLKVCGCNNGAAIYSTIPYIDEEKSYFAGLYAHSLKRFIIDNNWDSNW